MNQTRLLSILLLASLGSFTACDRIPNRISFSHDSDEHRITRSYLSRIGDKDIEFGLSDEDISRIPAWSPKEAPPIPISDVIQTAERELPKYTHGSQGWYTKGVSIEQIHRSSNGHDKWIYLVDFGGIGDGDYVQIPINMTGAPLKGIEKPHRERPD